jgi:hypothetical protein
MPNDKTQMTPPWLKTEMEILSIRFLGALLALAIFLIGGAVWLVLCKHTPS